MSFEPDPYDLSAYEAELADARTFAMPEDVQEVNGAIAEFYALAQLNDRVDGWVVAGKSPSWGNEKLELIAAGSGLARKIIVDTPLDTARMDGGPTVTTFTEEILSRGKEFVDVERVHRYRFVPQLAQAATESHEITRGAVLGVFSENAVALDIADSPLLLEDSEQVRQFFEGLTAALTKKYPGRLPSREAEQVLKTAQVEIPRQAGRTALGRLFRRFHKSA